MTGNRYDGTLNALVNYWAITDQELTAMEKDIYIYLCFQMNNMITPEEMITIEEVLSNITKYFNVTEEESNNIIIKLKEKGYINSKGWPSLGFIPNEVRYGLE